MGRALRKIATIFAKCVGDKVIIDVNELQYVFAIYDWENVEHTVKHRDIQQGSSCELHTF